MSQLKKWHLLVQTISLSSFFSCRSYLRSVIQPWVEQPTVAEYCLKKRSAVTNYCLLVVLVFFNSCQKEKLANDAVINSTTQSAASAIALSNLPDTSINYGAFIHPPFTGSAWLTFQQNVAGQLGVSCLRGSTRVPGTGKSPKLLTSGYHVLFNFNTGTNTGTPAPFVSNIDQYQTDLNAILALCSVKPVVAVIENEESNRFYYSGTASEYLQQLSAAIGVMHASDIPVANGGITSQGLNYLVYQDFLSQGKTDSAQQFKLLARVAVKDSTTKARGAFIDTLLNSYTQMGLDYINFHWKCSSPDIETLRQAINYLKKRAGNIPVISNEFGQLDLDPNTLLAMVQQGTDQGFPYIVWYSPDESHNKKATPLQYNDATLTPSGVAYQGYLAQ